MDILPRALVETKREVAREEKVFVDIVALREDAVAAAIGNIEANDLAAGILAVFPGELERRAEHAGQNPRVVSGAACGDFLKRGGEKRFRQAFLDRRGRGDLD